MPCRDARACAAAVAGSLRFGLGVGLTCLLLVGPLLARAGETEPYTDQRTGVSAWRFSGEGIQVQFVQRLTDQTRAFFLGRGFDRSAVDHLARHCVFQTIVRNVAPAGGPALTVKLSEWRVITAAGRHPLVLKKQWQAEWRRREVPKSARIAFQWALFPTQQTFEPGDWNMGMTTYPVSPGDEIDLRLVWHLDGQRHEDTARGLVCATNEVSTEDNT